MDMTLNDIIMEIFSPEQCEVIGVTESVFDIYTKDADGKKTVDLDKAKTEFERIKKMSEPEAQANKSKQLIHAIVGCIGYSGGAIGVAWAASFGSIILGLVGLLITVAGFMFLIKMPPATKEQYYMSLNDDLTTAITKLSKEYNKIKDKDPAKAKELNAKIEELTKLKEKAVAEVKKTSY